VDQQIREGMEFHKKRYRRASRFLAYFQAFSNTYAPLDQLRHIYDQALAFPNVMGLVIGTRPDCIDDEKLDYFARLSEDYYVILEYGMESFYNRTLEHINRGHSVEDSIVAIEKTAQWGVKTGAHLIFGLPGETREDMLKEAGMLSRLPLDTVKFHQLQIIRNTPMAREYREHPEWFDLFELEDYIRFIIRFMERLNPGFVIERFSGEAPPWFLEKDMWGEIRTHQVRNKLEQRMKEWDTWQGKHFKKIAI
jgi:radical SAM protein (TIGR01212 family)